MDPFGLFYQIILSVKVTILDIDQQYLDDISKLSEKMKDELPVKIAQQGLKINEKKKPKEYNIKRAHCDYRWRDCKLFGYNKSSK